jgi:ribosomal protein S18 acetylase RimI-like enzyme
MSDGRVRIRAAAPGDNAALLRLSEACTMEGDIAMRVDRSPDFFALNRLEGEAWQVAVAEDETGEVRGCVAAARREVWLNGARRTVCYASDLKVHPSARGGGAADELTRYAARMCAEMGGPDVPILVMILSGNARMERRAPGPRGTPMMARAGTIDAIAIPLLWERTAELAGVSVRAATAADLEAMAELWAREAPRRQFAGAWDADGLRGFIADAPGLDEGGYLLALDARGRLRGFMGVWEQSAFKQLKVVGYSTRLAAVRRAINLAAPLIGATRLPPPGETLPMIAAVHICATEPAVLRALLLDAYRRHRGHGHAVLTISLDPTDPLVAATRGLLGQPTRASAYLSSASGGARAPLDGRPLYFETALV